MKNQHKFTRRDFLKLSSAAALPLTLSGFPLVAHAMPSAALINGENDKVLVLVELQGGNDGLATLYHNSDYANLAAVRSNIIIPENSLLALNDDYSFHSSMTGLQQVWNNQNLGILQSVGYPNQNRSHFRSSDIWNSASAAEEYLSTGWIGRFYDLNYAAYPNGYPNMNCPDPFALTMGKIVSDTCQGINSNYSLALEDPSNPGTALVGAPATIPANCYGDALTFVNDTVVQTNAYSAAITSANSLGNNLSTKYTGSELSEKLKNVARLISGGLQTKIYIVQLGGFDTHDNQVVDSDTETGTHGALLQELSDAICAFQEDLTLLGINDRVVGMTYSEFGRRIRSNGGLGTDHGDAAPLFLFGTCIENQILGTAPTIDTSVGIDEGIPMQYDFRNVYGTILSKWFGVTETDVQNLIFPEFSELPIFKDGPDCAAGVVLAVEFLNFEAKKKEKMAQLKWQTISEYQSQYFEIQHSEDGRNFKRIGKVNANGGDSITNYEYLHETPVNGINYYRLKEVETNGESAYSEIRSLEFASLVEDILVYPNPTKERFTISIAGNEHPEILVILTNELGQKIRRFNIPPNTHQHVLKVEKLLRGVYYLRFSIGNEIKVKRITLM